MAFNLDAIIEEKLVGPEKTDDVRYAVLNNIKNKKSSVKKLVDKELSQSDLKRILEKYVEVPRSAWLSIPINTYIRYINAKDGTLKSGGRIMSIDPEDGGHVFKLTKYSRGRITWHVNTKLISKIYKLKPEHNFDLNPPKKTAKKGGTVKSDSAEDITTNTTMVSPAPATTPEAKIMENIGNTLLFEDNGYLTKRIENVEQRIDQVENNLKQIFNMVKAMYQQNKKY